MMGVYIAIVVMVGFIILLLITSLILLLMKIFAIKSPKPASSSTTALSQINLKSPSSPKGVLQVIRGSLQGREFTIPSTGLCIGRHETNDIVLPESLVSRYHALIRLENGNYVLYDRDSTNGTWVNGRRVGRHILNSGDRIQIGPTEFIFYKTGETPSEPAPYESPVSIEETVGDYFEGYILLEEIGKGGMSKVFKARSPDGRIVALKILQTDEEYVVRKYQQWGNQIARLLYGHPNIATIYRFGQSQDGRLYLEEEFIEGTSLRYLIREITESQDKERRIVNIIGQVCQALTFAHNRGVIHRDIKPENILVGSNDATKVTDFGIAKLLSSVTVTRGKIVGTPEYISPEQIEGRAIPASDIYSLGVVLYELLTGRVPFPRPNLDDQWKAMMKVIEMHKKYKPRPPSSLYPWIPPRLEKVAMRALEKKPEKRYHTAEEMAKDLGYEIKPMGIEVSSFPPGAKLIVKEGARRGQAIPLMGRQVVIGRNDLNPQDAYISREHIILFPRGNQIWLQDISRNGTQVNGEWVSGEFPLKRGDIIIITDNVLEVQF